MRGESSEVCPFGSVAVTVTGWPTSIVKARSALKVVWPAPSVTTSIEPRYRSPSVKSWGRPSQGGLA